MDTKMTTPCNSLEEVRQNIDKIDNELISLIAERSRYVNQAAEFKKSAGEVSAPDRLNEVIRKVRTLAEQKGLNPILTEKVFRTMIKAFTEQELAEFNPAYRDIKDSYY